MSADRFGAKEVAKIKPKNQNKIRSHVDKHKTAVWTAAFVCYVAFCCREGIRHGAGGGVKRAQVRIACRCGLLGCRPIAGAERKGENCSDPDRSGAEFRRSPLRAGSAA